MADSYYPSDSSEDASEDSPPADKESDKPSTETTLIPASFFGDAEKKPGDVCKIRIVANHDGEIEAEYVKHDKDSDKDDDSGKDPREMSVADSMMSDA